MDKIGTVLDKARQLAPGRWDDGEQLAIICNDAVVVISMSDDGSRKLGVNVIAGKPDYMDIDLELVEKAE